ncbi:MAG: acyltransferase [Elusimicrobia bacterium]|nr:acyltransferase [Candidatus Obscuribacterium magneticum]
MKTSYYTTEELGRIGFKKIGHSVLISRKTSIYSPELIEIGSHVRIDDFCILSGSIKIGNHIHIGAYTGLFGKNGINLNDYAGLSTRVAIFTVSEDYLGRSMTNPTIPSKYRRPKEGPVTIGSNAIVGAGTVILPGVILGEGTAVGALSLVIGSIKPWKIAKGIPAKPIRDREKDIIKTYQNKLEEEERKNDGNLVQIENPPIPNRVGLSFP